MKCTQTEIELTVTLLDQLCPKMFSCIPVLFIPEWLIAVGLLPRFLAGWLPSTFYYRKNKWKTERRYVPLYMWGSISGSDWTFHVKTALTRLPSLTVSSWETWPLGSNYNISFLWPSLLVVEVVTCCIFLCCLTVHYLGYTFFHYP